MGKNVQKGPEFLTLGFLQFLNYGFSRPGKSERGSTAAYSKLTEPGGPAPEDGVHRQEVDEPPDACVKNLVFISRVGRTSLRITPGSSIGRVPQNAPRPPGSGSLSAAGATPRIGG